MTQLRDSHIINTKEQELENEYRIHEYDSLRDELIHLLDRSHDVWKWGLVTIGAILGTSLTIFLNIQNLCFQNFNINPTTSSCFKNFSDNVNWLIFLIGIIFLLISSSIGFLKYQIDDTVNRLGAYLAIFHDIRNNKPTITHGWQVWNRIDRFWVKEIKVKEKGKNPRTIEYSGSFSSYAIVVAIAELLIIFLIWIFVELNIITIIISVVGNFLVLIIEAIIFNCGETRSIIKWNQRWLFLSHLSESEIKEALIDSGIS